MTPFVWFTNDGAALRPSEMDTLHLFHLVRMLWNHTVPPEARLEPFRAWAVSWDADFRREAMDALSKELTKRELSPDLTLAQCGEWAVIIMKRRVFDEALKTMPLNEAGDVDGDDPFYGLDEFDLV